MGVLYSLGSGLSSHLSEIREFFRENFLETGDGRSPILHALLRLNLKKGNGVLKTVDEGIRIHVTIVPNAIQPVKPLRRFQRICAFATLIVQ